MINMHLPAKLLNFIVFFHAISCIKSLSRHRLLVAGIFGMNLKSYLEEHVVCGFLKSKHLPSFKYMSHFPFAWIHYHLGMLPLPYCLSSCS
jgi:hypothetical protein